MSVYENIEWLPPVSVQDVTKQMLTLKWRFDGNVRIAMTGRRPTETEVGALLIKIGNDMMEGGE